MITRYLTTTLILVSPSDLRPLTTLFEQTYVVRAKCVQWKNGTWHANFEAYCPRKCAEEGLAPFLEVMEEILEQVRDCWMQCTVRELSLHFRTGGPGNISDTISAATLTRIAKLGIRLKITVDRPKKAT